jgi:mRNA interferase RelE/StbE
MPVRTQFHPPALAEFRKLGREVQRRVRRSVLELEQLDDARAKLVPTSRRSRGFWKLRVGDYRLVCELRHADGGQLVIPIHVVHRREAYSPRSIDAIKRRSDN